MPELLSLDIHSPDDDRHCAVDVFGASVRIGRGPQCEVRLQDAALAEVECLLRRRGTTWYVLPQGMLGNLAIDGRSVEGLMPLGLGMVLRVGDHRLVLRRKELGPRQPGSFEAPIDVDPRPIAAERPSTREKESFERWQAQLAHRDRWLKSRREERRWQAKWQAAGQGLSRPATPEPEPKSVEAPPDEPQIVPPTPTTAPPPIAALVPVPEPVAIELEAEVVAEIPAFPTPSEVQAEIEPIEESPGADDPAATPEPLEIPEPVVLQAEPVEAPAPVLEPVVAVETPAVEQGPASDSSARPALWPAETEGPFVTDTSQSPQALEWSRVSTGAAPEAPTSPVEEGWPSLREVFGSSPPPPRQSSGSSATTRKLLSGPKLSDPTPPATWNLPVWAALMPATLLVLAIGAVGCRLAWTWGQDDRTAGLLADRLMREQPPEADAPVEEIETPAASWWASTPSHLRLRAQDQASRPGQPESQEAVNFLLHTAHNAAPLDSAVRLAMATESESDGNAAVRNDPLGSLGLSNDALALRQTGRGLLAAGKVDAGLAAYGQAIRMAATVELKRASMPSFVDDSRDHRFLLPLEETVGDLVRDLDERTPGGYAAWSKAIPDVPIANLAVYRLLTRRNRPERDLAFDRLSALPECQDRAAEALRLASQAEAEALRESYPASIKLYEEAIAAMPDDLLRRTWQFNLGEVARLAGESVLMREAWDAARGPSPHDLINQSLVNARGRAGLNKRSGTTFDDSDSVVPSAFPVKVPR
jgi:hypothetical protein